MIRISVNDIMINEFTYKGNWFLPSNTAVKLPGVISFDTKSDAELELFGTFETEWNKLHEPNFILGITTTGKFITLHKCYEFSRNNTNGLKTSKYSALYVFIGCHYHSNQDFKFSRFEAKFKNIDKWIKKFGFKLENNFEENTVDLSYKRPEDIVFKISESLIGKFSFNYYHPFSEHTDEINIRQSVFVELESSTPLPFDEMMNNLMLFQNFLTLGTFESAYPTVINAITIAENEKKENVEYFNEMSYKPGFNYVAPRRGYERFLFYYPDIELNFALIIQKWYQLSSNIDPVTNLLFGSFYNREKNIENRFLNIAQSLETFHRRFRDYKPFPKKEYNEWVAALVAPVDEKYKEMLKGKLDFGNEPPLHKRLEELIDNLPVETIQKMVKDKIKFISNIKNSRNYYTHYSETLKKKALAGNELYALTEKLRVILIGTVLLETGFTIEEINNLLKRNESFFFNHLVN